MAKIKKVKKTQTTLEEHGLALAEWIIDASEQLNKYDGLVIPNKRSDYPFVRALIKDINPAQNPSHVVFVVAICLKPRTKETQGGWIHIMVGGIGPIFELYLADVIKVLPYHRKSEIFLKEILLDFELAYPYHGNIHAHVVPVSRFVKVQIKDLIKQVQHEHGRINRGLFKVNYEVKGLVYDHHKQRGEWRSQIGNSWLSDVQEKF